jgi:hypothetical protein
VGSPWVAYIVVGLAISMIAVLSIGIISLTNKKIVVNMPNQGKKEDE